MRLLYVVQRYGPEVFGGAEYHCRQFATRMAVGHDVEVLTSCAVSYVDWANVYRPGSESLDGVTVHRLPVAKPREDRYFTLLNNTVRGAHRPIPAYLQREWIRIQGPYLPELAPWLRENTASYDAVIFFTYLYYTSWAGLPVASAGSVPTVLHPTAHHEPMLYLQLFDTMFRHPSALAFSTEEEAALVRRRFRTHQPSIVVGVGIETEVGGSESAFRAAYGLGDRPYLLFIGRVDPGKGSDELFEFFAAYKARNPGPLALVIVGEPVKPLPPHPDVSLTGFVDNKVKESAIAGALALVQPSYFESFSMVLTEAWVHRKPALVQAACDVLVGQAHRSGGALPYRGFAEFEAAVDMILNDSALARSLGEAGRRYAVQTYSWERVLQDYERFLMRLTGRAFEPA
ncbi:MAG: glycosyltransferase family 4 protein [Actinobacteria bacterium]|nr:glycosyltransferase family 4 protein [Actinomycetota bacterium]